MIERLDRTMEFEGDVVDFPSDILRSLWGLCQMNGEDFATGDEFGGSAIDTSRVRFGSRRGEIFERGGNV